MRQYFYLKIRSRISPNSEACREQIKTKFNFKSNI